jgi:nitroreductase
MEFFETVKIRHSYRGAFGKQAVSRHDLNRIMLAGLAAPSGCNRQTTTFVVVDDAELLAAIGSMSQMKAMQTAKAMIACIVNKDPGKVCEGMTFEVEDCSAAVENILLAIADLGYASVWIDGWLRREERAAEIGAMLGVPEDKIIRVILPVGVPVEAGGCVEKLAFERRAWFNSYGQIQP